MSEINKRNRLMMILPGVSNPSRRWRGQKRKRYSRNHPMEPCQDIRLHELYMLLTRVTHGDQNLYERDIRIHRRDVRTLHRGVRSHRDGL